MKNQLLSIRISHSFMAASLMIISVSNRHHGEGFNKCFCLAEKKSQCRIKQNSPSRAVLTPEITTSRFFSKMQGKVLCRWARPSEIESTYNYMENFLCACLSSEDSLELSSNLAYHLPRSKWTLAVRPKWRIGRGRWLSQWTQVRRPKFGSSVFMSKAACGHSLQLSPGASVGSLQFTA